MKFKELKINDIFTFKGSPGLRYQKIDSKTVKCLIGGREIKLTEVDRKTEVFKVY